MDALSAFPSAWFLSHNDGLRPTMGLHSVGQMLKCKRKVNNGPDIQPGIAD